MALPGPGNGPSEATAIMAYELHRDGMSWREVAAAMAHPPHRCGGHTTAGRWIAIGQALLTQDPENKHKVHPTRKRRFRRDMAIDALDQIRVRVAADAVAGDLDLVRVAAYRVEVQTIQLAAQLGGWRAAPEPARMKVTGGGGDGQAPRELIESLLALPPDELREALGSPPPDY